MHRSIVVVLVLLCCSPFRSGSNGQPTLDGDSNAARECGNLHRLDMHQFANSKATFINAECAVQCTIAGHVLLPDPINEGYTCPLNLHGICKRGQCIVRTEPQPMDDPIRECSNLHRIDFHQVNSTGTRYTNDGCLLLCFIGGSIASENPINEGFACLANAAGLCSEGKCQLDDKTVRTIQPSTKLSTISTKTTATPKATTPLTTRPTAPTTPAISDIDQIVTRFISGNFTRELLKSYASVCLKDHDHRDRHFDIGTCHQDCNQISKANTDPKAPFWDNSTPCTLSNYYGPALATSYYFLLNIWESSAYKYPVGDALLAVVDVLTQVNTVPDHLVAYRTNGRLYSTAANLTLPLFDGDIQVGHMLVEFEFKFR